jgi:hypothetical protein
MRRYKDGTSVFDVIPILIIIALSVFGLLALLFMPQIISYAKTLSLPPISWPPMVPEIPEPPITQNQTTEPGLPQDMRLYYSLKNKSCQALSENFLISTHDESDWSASGLSGEEASAAALMLKEFSFVSDTRTYLRGDSMKKVLITPEGNHTSIWKDGRIYQCNPNCTMRLLGDAGWQAYLDGLAEMRSGCAYFGRTKLPSSVNLTRLLSIQNTGRVEMNGSRCENFLIFGNKAYAQTLLNSSLYLNDDQRAVLWSLAHQAGPFEECLDDGNGIIVYRSIAIDLTRSYRFDYAAGGFMRVDQQTTLTYFTDDVPESFLALPK